MIKIKKGTIIPSKFPYGNAIITAVAKNGWCKGYFPSNVKNGNVEDALFSARVSWVLGLDTPYKIIGE